MIDNVKRFPQVYKYRSFQTPLIHISANSVGESDNTRFSRMTLTKATLKSGKQLHFILDLLKHGCRNLSNIPLLSLVVEHVLFCFFRSFFFPLSLFFWQSLLRSISSRISSPSLATRVKD